MAEIFVEGIGLIQIQGDRPTPGEMQAIEDNLTAGFGGKPQETEIEEDEFQEDLEPPGPFTGRTGLMPPSMTSDVRGVIESLPAMAQLGAEITPSLIGTMGGAALGAATGPFAPVAIPLLAGAGGLLGEFLAQETGVAPESNVALGLSAAAPIGGVVLGKVFQLGRRIIGPGMAKLPPIATARARTITRRAVGEFNSLGGKILEKQSGRMKQTSEALFKAARKTVPKIGVESLQRSIKALGRLGEELKQVAVIPEAAQALSLVNQSLEILTKRGGISFDVFIDMRQLIGRIISRTEKTGGLKLNTAKQTFKGMADDMDAIANRFSPGRGTEKGFRTGARLTQVAAKRAKLEFAIRDIERATVKFTSNVPGKDDIILDVGKLRKWFFDITNPKSEIFDRNFTTAMRKELPKIKTALQKMDTAVKAAGSPAGPGSIIIRGAGAREGRALIGGLIGFGTAGPIGAAIGGVAGASLPEMITAIFVTKGGTALLDKMVTLGKGELSKERWAIITQFLIRAAQVEIKLKGQSTATIPLEERKKMQEENIGTLSE